MTDELTRERTDFLESLTLHRMFLRQTVRDLDDEQVRRRTTISELTLASIIKHVTYMEEMWTRFIVEGTGAIPAFDESTSETWTEQWRVADDVTLTQLLDDYAATNAHTDHLIRTLSDLDVSHPLPSAPWFQPGAAWSARRVLLHLIAETAQHAGHADIIRESLDGAKTMG